MTKPTNDTTIEALLRADAVNFQHEYIANDGFTDVVMAKVNALPSPAAALSTKMRFTIIAAATFIAMLIAITAGAGGKFLIDAVMDLATNTVTPNVLVLGVLMVAACAMAVSAARSE